MLDKEEISKLKINIFNQCDDETIKLFADMLKYTEQLETREQKLIEKLEERIKNTKKQYSENTLLNIKIDGKLDTLEEILSILKGEKE